MDVRRGYNLPSEMFRKFLETVGREDVSRWCFYYEWTTLDRVRIFA